MRISVGVEGRWREHGQPSRVLEAPAIEIMLWALVMSTQFLSQPFIWRDYPLTGILAGWSALSRDRLIVYRIIGTALVLVGRIRTRALASRLALMGSAAVAGAAMGEFALHLLIAGANRQDLVSLVGRNVRWSLVGGAAAVMIYFWRSDNECATAGERTILEEASLRELVASTHIEVLQRQIEPLSCSIRWRPSADFRRSVPNEATSCLTACSTI